MHPRLPVRRAMPADARAIAEVHIASWQVAYRGFFPDVMLDTLSLDEREALWAPRLAQSSHDIWVTGESPRVTGFLDACPSHDDVLPPPEGAEIAALYIHPDAWGSGCGRALYEAAFAHLRETPAETVIVWVLAGNAPARHFYEKLGFTVDDAHKEVALFDVMLPAVRYRQSLR